MARYGATKSFGRASLAICLATAVAAAALFVPAAAQAPPRALDHIAPNSDGVVLAVFNPEVYNIRALEALRANGILDIPGLTVVGVYHDRQTGDFEAAAKYVADRGLDWLKFHAVSAEISEPVLYKTNACTPEFEALVERADGVILFGGPDIPPSVYNKKTNLLTSITDPYRHYFELSAVFHLLGGSQDPGRTPLLARRPGFPVLGICLGFQTLNVGTGGSLIQDIWAELYGAAYVEDAIALGPEQWHNNPYRILFPLDRLMGYNFHSLQLGDKSVFCSAMGFKSSDHPRILSSHHQAAAVLGKDLVATATSRDGRIVEALEHKTFPNVLGVQFHPEHPLLWDTEPRFRQKPGEPLTSYNAILTGTPPSLEFNKAIWAWFAGRLRESRGAKAGLD
jgi:putative glutamine amidotransferase